MGTIIPVADLDRRMPEAGRIRLGVKTERAMKSIDTFRFTSPYKDLIDKIAEMYGGVSKPWSDDRARIQDQHEVITDATEINIFLPQNGLSQSYEMWTGGGRQRYCNGAICVIMGREDPEEVACLCHAKGVSECKLYTRLNVILPELPFKGVFRMETKGWNAGHEMPGMFDAIQLLHSTGNMVQATLGLEKRSDVKNGKKRKWVTPTIAIVESPHQILAGHANVAAIAAGGTPAVERPELSVGSVDDVIVEAELVEDLTDDELEVEDLLRDDAIQFDLDPDRFLAAVHKQAKGDYANMRKAHDQIAAGTREPLMFKSNGTIEWAKA